MFRFLQNHRSSEIATQSLTPKLFYDLAGTCQTFAEDLARLDPLRVDLPSCHRYNEWIASLRRYQELTKQITMRPARPIARWQLLTLAVVAWIVLELALPGRVDRMLSTSILRGWFLGMVILFFVPQRFYGTTVELLEGRVLLIVETMQRMLQNGDIQFSEAAFFRAKEILESTQRELRQQLDLVHRNDRSYL